MIKFFGYKLQIGEFDPPPQKGTYKKKNTVAPRTELIANRWMQKG